MVGNPQDIQCVVSTVSGVELSSVMISWMGPGGESITNDSRVTISPTTSTGNNYTSSLQFTYLMEGDNGTYTCNVMILETTNLISLQLEDLTSKYFLVSIYMHRRRSRSGWSGFGRTTFIQGKNKISFLQKASNEQKCWCDF